MVDLDFSKNNGLIPVIAQDYQTGEVLMLAFMNEEAWEKTQGTGIAHYYSRTRKTLWKKGGSSGHIQKVKEIFVDCDNDTLLLKVEQIGAACHKGYRSCFYRKLENGRLKIMSKKAFNPKEVYKNE
ncbi:phosphoribosyl-AMP cyclohydrolase [Candidatus Desulfofervidus auxilii]|uniref:Phosphoribosyl-AMP cyclohydrolase n=1 Tax=Desulfofervidus auxilii TaxID=1621989 RepID=A0A7U4QMW4_DESA2|nr:phosphoribosyl-AMP cyclohydrolase [Candidatus Desulfofervidus auxilii]AMM42302.1 phosphoribosyl-AMP cyclohydrolase [Candidatus Desulfofervidus auxilii]